MQRDAIKRMGLVILIGMILALVYYHVPKHVSKEYSVLLKSATRLKDGQLGEFGYTQSKIRLNLTINRSLVRNSRVHGNIVIDGKEYPVSNSHYYTKNAYGELTRKEHAAKTFNVKGKIDELTDSSNYWLLTLEVYDNRSFYRVYPFVTFYITKDGRYAWGSVVDEHEETQFYAPADNVDDPSMFEEQFLKTIFPDLTL